MTRRISLAVVTDWSQKGLRAPKTVRNRQTSENAKPLKTRGFRESRDRRERPYWSHNPKVVGSNPTPATNESMAAFGRPLSLWNETRVEDLGGGMRSMQTVPTPATNEDAGQAPFPEGAFCIPSAHWSRW